MTPQHFQAETQRKAKELENYIVNVFPQRAGKIALRFIDGNFRAQGWQGQRFSLWKPNKRNGTILVDKGRLRRSIHFRTAPGQVSVFSNSPYAAVHNRGFNGTVTVKEHTRYKYVAQKIGTGRFNKSGTERLKTIHTVASSSDVSSHTRKMNIEKRQFMPEGQNGSPVFANAIRREIVREIKQIFK